jgi:hypothetical protein
LRGRRADASVSIDLALWGAARSTATFGDAPLAGLRHASRRGSADIATLQGGRLDNRWNLPRTAAGKPFDFDGTIEALSLIAEADSLRRAACAASRTEEADGVEGYVLENLYLHVRPMRRVAFVGSGDALGSLAAGQARLIFDVRFAQPILPDPYAANWSVSHLDVRMAGSALHVGMLWADGGTPALRPRLRQPVTFPVQPQRDDPRGDLARDLFYRHLEADRAHLGLLDLSGRDHQFGVALEALPEAPLVIDDANRLAWPLRRVRLLMQPQVHWEPVQVLANPDAKTFHDEMVESKTHGGPSLVGANTVKLVPVLPGQVGVEIATVANGQHRAGALFGLPFGLHAFARMDPVFERPLVQPEVLASLREPVFFNDHPDEVFAAAKQLRLIATGARFPDGAADPSRSMLGVLSQTRNLVPRPPPSNNLTSVLHEDVGPVVNATFANVLPLHQADLSGYGLSTFSRWRRRLPPPPAKEGTGVTQLRFDVLIGRTSYEVIELQSRLWCPQCRMVRTVILERRNSGQVQRLRQWLGFDRRRRLQALRAD